jgi:hypothetical protein
MAQSWPETMSALLAASSQTGAVIAFKYADVGPFYKTRNRDRGLQRRAAIRT